MNRAESDSFLNFSEYSMSSSYVPYQDMEEGTSSSQGQQIHGAMEPEHPVVSKYDTALPFRIDLAAALTYSLGCISGIIFLMFEYKNDYVRFNAWQSCILFTPILLLHFVFILISGPVGVAFNWILFIADILLIGLCG